jgi:MYXO-CTERM domain-containing protein
VESERDRVKKPILLALALAGAVAATLKRRRAHASEGLWREATSDSSR